MAGFRTEPPMSFPIPKIEPPDPKRDPSPQEDPQDSLFGSKAFPVAPKAGLLHCKESIVCGTFVRQNGIPPKDFKVFAIRQS